MLTMFKVSIIRTQDFVSLLRRLRSIDNIDLLVIYFRFI